VKSKFVEDTGDQTLSMTPGSKKTSVFSVGNMHGILTQLRFDKEALTAIRDWCDERIKETSKPKKNCPLCHETGTQYFADSFDKDNGTACPCTK
jgi:hypothetical protein